MFPPPLQPSEGTLQVEVAANVVVVSLLVDLESFVDDSDGARGDARNGEAEMREPQYGIGSVCPVWGGCDG